MSKIVNQPCVVLITPSGAHRVRKHAKRTTRSCSDFFGAHSCLRDGKTKQLRREKCSPRKGEKIDGPKNTWFIFRAANKDSALSVLFISGVAGASSRPPAHSIRWKIRCERRAHLRGFNQHAKKGQHRVWLLNQTSELTHEALCALALYVIQSKHAALLRRRRHRLQNWNGKSWKNRIIAHTITFCARVDQFLRADHDCWNWNNCGRSCTFCAQTRRLRWLWWLFCICARVFMMYNAEESALRWCWQWVSEDAAATPWLRPIHSHYAAPEQ